MIRGSGGSKSRLAKAVGANSCGQRRNEQLHAAVARSTFSSQNVQNALASDHFSKFRFQRIARRCGAKHICNSKCQKNWHSRASFGCSDVEKCHAAVALSAFATQNVKKLTVPGQFLDVRMWKNGTLLWREVHFQIKICKTPGFWSTFGGSDIEKVSDRWDR